MNTTTNQQTGEGNALRNFEAEQDQHIIEVLRKNVEYYQSQLAAAEVALSTLDKGEQCVICGQYPSQRSPRH